MADWFKFGAAVLATWRVTHLLANEDGPAGSIARLRETLGESELGALMDCFGCMSMWVAAPLAFYVARKPRDRAVAWLALSGGACLLNQAVSCGGSDELLRSAAANVQSMADSPASFTSLSGHGTDQQSGERNGE